MRHLGELVHAVRERHGLSVTQLAIRAGLEEAAIGRFEQGSAALSREQVTELLLVMGERPVMRDGVIDASEPIPVEFDVEELDNAARQSVSERLERSAQWNRFAAALAQAELRPLPPAELS